MESTENIPSVVRFNPEVVAYQSEEEQTEAPSVLDANINHGDLGRDSNLSKDEGMEDKNKNLQQDIVKYLRYQESKKYWTSNNNSFQESSNGKGRNWNLVKKRFHENDVFFAKEAKVHTNATILWQNVMNHIL